MAVAVIRVSLLDRELLLLLSASDGRGRVRGDSRFSLTSCRSGKVVVTVFDDDDDDDDDDSSTAVEKVVPTLVALDV